MLICIFDIFYWVPIITFQVEKDFELQYPNREEFKDWNIFLRNWTCFTRSIVNIRRGSVKDKHALQLLSQLDSAELNKGRYYFNCFFY